MLARNGYRALAVLPSGGAGGTLLEALPATTLAASGTGGWVAVCGSLPPGVKPDFYARRSPG